MPRGWEHIYTVVRRIPPGRIATYGQVARLAGGAGQARQVGYALAALEVDSDVPWHRVVNAQGRISLRGDGHAAAMQRARLESEGVTFQGDRVRLEQWQWQPVISQSGLPG